MIARARLLLVGEHAHHQRVVVTVVGALDLQDLRATGEGAGDPAGVERRLGPGVAEAPLRQAVALREVLGDRERLLRRLREVRALRDAPLDRLDHLRMRVSHHHHAVAVVEVDVLVPVDVPHVRALAAPHVDRVRRPRLPRGGDAAGEEPLGLLAVRERAGVLAVERLGLALRELLDPVEVDRRRS